MQNNRKMSILIGFGMCLFIAMSHKIVYGEGIAQVDYPTAEELCNIVEEDYSNVRFSMGETVVNKSMANE